MSNGLHVTTTNPTGPFQKRLPLTTKAIGSIRCILTCLHFGHYYLNFPVMQVGYTTFDCFMGDISSETTMIKTQIRFYANLISTRRGSTK
jgi:hypothetical protein